MGKQLLSKTELAVIALDRIEEAGFGEEAQAIREALTFKSVTDLQSDTVNVLSLRTRETAGWRCSGDLIIHEDTIRTVAIRSGLPRPVLAWQANRPSNFFLLDDEEAEIAREAVDLIDPLLQSCSYPGFPFGTAERAYKLRWRIEELRRQREQGPRRPDTSMLPW